MTQKENQDWVLDYWPATSGRNLAGVISKEEHWQGALEFAQMVPNDERFVRTTCAFWGVSEDSHGGIDEKEAYGIIALMRQRLVTLANGS